VLLRSQFSSLRWRTRLILWAGAILAGLLVVAFAKLADLGLAAFYWLAAQGLWVPFLLTPAVGMAAVWLTRRYFPGAQGSGIPQVIAATRLAIQGQAVDRLVSLRIAVGKVLVGAFALVGGYSAGREGPSVQVAASVLHWVHRFLPSSRALRDSDLILAGGAAGIAAAFNTPLAGIVFAVEELGRRLEARTSGVLVSTIILSGLTAIALLGNYNYFGQLTIKQLDGAIVLQVLVAGLWCGVLGGAFSRLMLWPVKCGDQAIWRWRAAHPVLFAGLCGLVVAFLGWLGAGLSYGSGYAVTAQVVAGSTELPWHALITRFLATLASYYSGIPGGIFAPSLAVGAAIGTTLAPLFDIAQGLFSSPLVALCMAGFLAAVTQSPITAAIIVMEMVDGHEMVISLMAISLLAKAVSSRISPELYQTMAIGFRKP